MSLVRSIPDRIVESARKFNAKLVPPEKYLSSLVMGWSIAEEVFLVTKNFVDASIHMSERLLYKTEYHQRRLSQYQNQRRLVVFVPGYMQAPSGFARLERFLSIELFDAFTYLWGGFPYSQDITLSAQQLESVVRDIVERTGVSEVYLLGHSQGGIIIRAMVQHGLGHDLPIRKCMFLSSPHQGTWAALASIGHRGVVSMAGWLPYIRQVQGESGLQLIPGSEFLRLLNARPLPENIAFYSVYYALDPIVWPPTNAILPYPEAQNYYVPKIGHAQSLYCSRAARIAMACLYGKSKARRILEVREEDLLSAEESAYWDEEENCVVGLEPSLAFGNE